MSEIQCMCGKHTMHEWFNYKIRSRQLKMLQGMANEGSCDDVYESCKQALCGHKA